MKPQYLFYFLLLLTVQACTKFEDLTPADCKKIKLENPKLTGSSDVAYNQTGSYPTLTIPVDLGNSAVAVIVKPSGELLRTDDYTVTYNASKKEIVVPGEYVEFGEHTLYTAVGDCKSETVKFNVVVSGQISAECNALNAGTFKLSGSSTVYVFNLTQSFVSSESEKLFYFYNNSLNYDFEIKVKGTITDGAEFAITDGALTDGKASFTVVDYNSWNNYTYLMKAGVVRMVSTGAGKYNVEFCSLPFRNYNNELKYVSGKMLAEEITAPSCYTTIGSDGRIIVNGASSNIGNSTYNPSSGNIVANFSATASQNYSASATLRLPSGQTDLKVGTEFNVVTGTPSQGQIRLTMSQGGVTYYAQSGKVKVMPGKINTGYDTYTLVYCDLSFYYGGTTRTASGRLNMYN